MFYYLLLFILAVDVFLLRLMVKKFKLKNNKYSIAAKISIMQFLFSGAIFLVIVFILLLKYGVSGTPADKGLVSVIDKIISYFLFFKVSFLLFNSLCKKYYESKLKQNILMYIILSLTTIILGIVAIRFFNIDTI